MILARVRNVAKLIKITLKIYKKTIRAVNLIKLNNGRIRKIIDKTWKTKGNLRNVLFKNLSWYGKKLRICFLSSNPLVISRDNCKKDIEIKK